MAGAVLHSASYVKESQTKLQENQRVRAVVPAPNDPQQITQQKQPERPISLELSLRSDKPGGDHCDCHCRPLNYVNPIHACSVTHVRLFEFEKAGCS